MLYSLQGYSDDVVILNSGDGTSDEFDLINGGELLVKSDGNVIGIINAIYGRNGCWSFSFCMYDEDTEIPSYITSVRTILNGDRAYSTELIINSIEPLTFSVL